MTQPVQIEIQAIDKTKEGTSSAAANLERLNNATKNTADSSDKAGLSFGKMATAVGLGSLAAGGFTFAIQKATQFLIGSVKESLNAEAVMAKVEARLKAMGGEYENLMPQIEDHAKAMLNLGFDDEETADSLSRLIQVTKDYGSAVQVQNVAMQLARSSGRSLNEATDVLIRAHTSGARVLKEFGIELDENATFADILGQVYERTQGQVEAYAETTAGSLTILKEKFANFMQSVGDAIVGTATFFADMVVDTFNLRDALGDTSAKVELDLDKINKATKNAGQGAKKMADDFKDAQRKLRDTLEDERDDLKKLEEQWVATQKRINDSIAKLQTDFNRDSQKNETDHREDLIDLFNRHGEKKKELEQQIKDEEDATKRAALEAELQVETAILEKWRGLEADAKVKAAKSDIDILSEKHLVEQVERKRAFEERMLELQNEMEEERQARAKAQQEILDDTTKALEALKEQYKVKLTETKLIVQILAKDINADIGAIVSSVISMRQQAESNARAAAAAAQAARFSVSQSQGAPLTNFGNASGGSFSRFASGGIVPGPLGAEQMAIVHGGETIIPPSSLRGPSGGNFDGAINVYITGNNISDDIDLEMLAERVGGKIMDVLKMNIKI